jgi:hypothetical protein
MYVVQCSILLLIMFIILTDIYTYNVIYVDQIIMYNFFFLIIFFTNVHNEITLLYMDDSDECYDSSSMECSALNFRCQCTQQKLQLMCVVLTFDPQYIFFSIFCKRQISIKLFYLYQTSMQRQLLL